MKKMILLLALIIPLSAQDSTKTKESRGQKVVRHLQDGEWRKFEAAHRRAHSKRGQPQTYIRESKRHNWKRTISYIVVGGLGYYIGTLEHKDKHGMKRRPYMGDRK
jgi:hypothetical protein